MKNDKRQDEKKVKRSKYELVEDEFLDIQVIQLN